MSRRMRAAIVVMVSFAVVVSLAGPAAASFVRSYAGETSQGYRIRAGVHVNEGRLSLKWLAVNRITLTCEDDSRLTYGISFGFGRLPLSGGRIDLDDVDPHHALHLHARFWPGHARGTVAFAVPALTAEEDAVLCTSGELDW